MILSNTAKMSASTEVFFQKCIFYSKMIDFREWRSREYLHCSNSEGEEEIEKDVKTKRRREIRSPPAHTVITLLTQIISLTLTRLLERTTFLSFPVLSFPVLSFPFCSFPVLSFLLLSRSSSNSLRLDQIP
jgi:hypothetical protein